MGSEMCIRDRDKSGVPDGGQPSGEFLALVVDAGKLESLRLELASLQAASPVRDRATRGGNDLRADRPEGIAKRSAKTLREAAPAAAEAKVVPGREAIPAPGLPEGALRRAAPPPPAKVKKAAKSDKSESRPGLKEDSPAGLGQQEKLADRQLGAAGKAAVAGKAQVRVEIRFRIVPD